MGHVWEISDISISLERRVELGEESGSDNGEFCMLG